MIPALALALLGATAAAETAAETPADAHYHPDDVAAASTLFDTAAKAVGPTFQDRQDRLRQAGRALEALELGVFMLGERAPDQMTTWSTDLRRQVTGQYLQVQRHVDLLQDDYARVFGQALDAAVAQASAQHTIVVCGATGISAMIGAKRCPGTDLNAQLAQTVDADPALARDLDEINGVPWPEISVPARTWPAVSITGDQRWVLLADLVQTYASGAVERRRDDLDRELDPLNDRIDAGDAQAIEHAQALHRQYQAALSQDGALLLDALGASLQRAQKKGAILQVGVCPNPTELGGCDGEDATAATLDYLAQDRKFLKAVAPLNAL